jgi:hypothetical protein
MPDVKPIPDSYPRVSPHLSISGAADAIDFYKSVFGARERMRMGMPDGTVAHAEGSPRAGSRPRASASRSCTPLAQRFPTSGR